MTSIRDWKKEANTQFHGTAKIKEYQSKVKKNAKWKQFEQDWIDTNVAPLMDFFGTEYAWEHVLKTKNIKFSGIETRTTVRAAKNTDVGTHIAQAVYEGDINGGHWYSRKKGQIDFFNSYQEYQILGTNIWCQTFALMNVANRLPAPSTTRSLYKYYYYNYYALLFIKECVDKITKRKDLQKAIQQCLRFPNICLNAIEIDFSAVTITNDSKNCADLSYPEIKKEFEEIENRIPPRKRVEKNDAEFFSIKDLKNMYKVNHLPFQTSWKKMDYIQNLTSA